MQIIFKRWPYIFILSSSFVMASAANATLGQQVASIAMDRSQLKVVKQEVSSNKGNYSVSANEYPGGGVVHEYISDNGVVFAISWSGKTIPDLRQLLGSYFSLIDERRNSAHIVNRRFIQINNDDFVFLSSGRQGQFAGHSWDPRLLPAGFDTSAIQ